MWCKPTIALSFSSSDMTAPIACSFCDDFRHPSAACRKTWSPARGSAELLLNKLRSEFPIVKRRWSGTVNHGVCILDADTVCADVMFGYVHHSRVRFS